MFTPTHPPRRPVNPRRAVWLKGGGRCAHCERPVTEEEMTLSKVNPRLRKRGYAVSNLHCLCKRCFFTRRVPGYGMPVRPGPLQVAAGIVPADWEAHVWEG